MGIPAVPNEKAPEATHIGIIVANIRPVRDWMQKNQTWVYIAIIGFCLSVTILYKLFQWYGL